MAKEVKGEKESNNLPAYTTVENIIALLDAYRRKNGKEEEAKVVFGKGTTAYTNTKSAIRTFGLINENDCGFTPFGRSVSYSTEEERKKVLLQFIVSYFPYEALLSNIFLKGAVALTEAVTIENFWGRFGQGSTQGNLEGAAILFGNMVEYVGLGKLIVGRRGKSTRIEWDPNAHEIFKSTLEKTDEPEQQADNVDEAPNDKPEETISIAETSVDEEKEETAPSFEQPTATYDVIPVEKSAPNIITRTSITPHITISVDMSEWSEEKIKSFFKYAYWKFEEETK